MVAKSMLGCALDGCPAFADHFLDRSFEVSSARTDDGGGVCAHGSLVGRDEERDLVIALIGV